MINDQQKLVNCCLDIRRAAIEAGACPQGLRIRLYKADFRALKLSHVFNFRFPEIVMGVEIEWVEKTSEERAWVEFSEEAPCHVGATSKEAFIKVFRKYVQKSEEVADGK